MTVEVSAKDFADLKRRVELAETKLAQHSGQFEFITGQLRDIQLDMHGKFGDIDTQFIDIKSKFAALDSKSLRSTQKSLHSTLKSLHSTLKLMLCHASSLR